MSQKLKRFYIKATWSIKDGQKIVRYWRNNHGIIGWCLPLLKSSANIYTQSAAEKFINSPRRSPIMQYELELVDEV